MNIKSLVNFSFKNIELIKQASTCGCYHCCDIFESKDIIQFTDDGKTALCPKCHVDAVLGDKSGFEITKNFLTEAKKYWF